MTWSGKLSNAAIMNQQREEEREMVGCGDLVREALKRSHNEPTKRRGERNGGVW